MPNFVFNKFAVILTMAYNGQNECYNGACFFSKTFGDVCRGTNRQFKTISATIGELQLKWHERDSFLISTFANTQRYWPWHKMAKMSTIMALVFLKLSEKFIVALIENLRLLAPRLMNYN